MSQKNKVILMVVCGVFLTLLFIRSYNRSNGSKKSNATSTSYAWSSVSSTTQENTESQSSQISEVHISQETTENEKTLFTLGDKFTFDGFEVTIGKTITTKKIDNTYSSKNGKTLIAVPVHLKNIGTETESFNHWNIDCFGSKGTETDNVNSIFDETSIAATPEMRPGASVDTFIYMLYDGDGIYGIDFSSYKETKTVEFKVSQ